MTRDVFSDDCPGCRPAILDITTGLPLPDESPAMQSVFALWRRTTRKERLVFHRVTCQNSQTPSDLRIFGDLARRIQQAVAAADIGGGTLN